MYEITLAESCAYQVPILEFRGTPTGIGVTKVRPNRHPAADQHRHGRQGGRRRAGRRRAGDAAPGMLHRRPRRARGRRTPAGRPRVRAATVTWSGDDRQRLSGFHAGRVVASASGTAPPTNRTIAGAAAIANPPIPAVSVMAESPMSGFASSSANEPRNSPSASSAGPVNQLSPVPAVWMPSRCRGVPR